VCETRGEDNREFYSAISEGDANSTCFRFLEKEGAEVLIDPIGNLVLYWLYQLVCITEAKRAAVGLLEAGTLPRFPVEWLWGCSIGGPRPESAVLASPPERKPRSDVTPNLTTICSRAVARAILIVARGLDCRQAEKQPSDDCREALWLHACHRI